MRALFALLVLANVGLWMWGTWYRGAAVAPAQAPRPPVNAALLRPISDPGVILVPRPPPPPPACYRLGPFAAASAAATAGAALQRLAVPFVARTQAVSVISGYRVFLPPLPSKAAAERERRLLRRRGFRDYSVMVLDGRPNAVSLGLFAVEDNARGRLHALAARGIRARLQAMYSVQPRYWLDIKPISAAATSALRQQDWGDPHAALTTVDCVAPPAAGAPTPTGPPGH